MKISFKRALALLLCAVMLFGMLPVQQVRADDIMQFTSMDTLRELADASYEGKSYAAFMGTEFVFEDIELPTNLVLSMPSAHVTIPAGVTVNLDTIQCTSLTVDGTLDARQVEAGESVAVSGSMNLRAYFLLDVDTKVTGMERISMEDFVMFYREGEVSTAQELKAVLAAAESSSGGSTYKIRLDGDGITLDEDLTIPQNFYLTVNAPLTVVSLFLDGVLDIRSAGSVNVQGDLIMGGYCGIAGTDKLTAENGMVQRVFEVTSSQELFRAANRAKEPVLEGAWEIINVSDPFELNRDVTIPAGCTMRVNVPFAVAAGSTLTVDGEMEIIETVTNRGTIRNNANVTVYGNVSGVLSCAEGGSYTGAGEMMVINSTYEDVLPGVDLSGYDVVEGAGIGGTRWIITAKEGAELVPDEWGNYSFTTMEELKQLASQNYNSWTWANYAGEEPFVIDESISLPRNLPLGSNGAAIEIAEGVVVDVHEGHFDKLVINGTLNIEALQLYQQLDVNGVLNVGNSAYFNEDAVINGMDRISIDDNASLGYFCNGYDLQSLKAACEKAAGEENSDIQYIFRLREANGILGESLTVPKNVNISVNQPMTVAEGVTLTLNCDLAYLNAPVTVYGQLEHNGWAAIRYPGATLTIAEGATYSGTGALIIHGITEGDPMVAIPGLDTTGYVLSNEGWQDGTTWQLTPEGYIPDDGTPGFSTLEELKELASQTYAEWTWVRYTGTEDLEITEDIVMPENLNIRTDSYGVTIAEGVNAKFNYLRCSWLEVNGDLHVKYGQITGDWLRVNGSLTVEENLDISYMTSISNISHIHMVNDWGTVNMVYNDAGMTLTLLRELIAELDPYEPPRIRHHVYLDKEETVIEEDLTVPSKVCVYFEKPLTVAAGATLTLNSDNANLYAPATIHGTLENNAWFYVSAHNGATMTFTEGSTYTGSGTIGIEKPAEMILEDVVTGLDLSSLYVRQDGDNWWYISTTQQGGGGNGGNDRITFSNVEELKELTTQTLDPWTSIYYVGEGPLVIDEIIHFSGTTMIRAQDYEVRIGKNGSLISQDLWCNSLIVEGTQTVNTLGVVTSLEVTGSLNVIDGIRIQEYTEVTGEENIHFRSDAAAFFVGYHNVGKEWLLELVGQAHQSTDPRRVFCMNLDAEEIVLDQDLVLPDNTMLSIYAPLTVAEGVTLVVNSRQMEVYGTMTIEGTLENNSWFMVSPYNNGHLEFAAGSTYAGSGTIAMEKDPSVSLESVLTGLDLSNLYVRQEGDYWWYIYFEGGSGGDGDGLVFETVEELKELASQTYDDWISISYIGSEPLVIDEQIVFSDYAMINVWDREVRITENGSLTTGELYCDTLIVEGEMTVNWVEVFSEVKITGTLNLKNSLNIKEITELTGRDNIRFLENWAHIDCDYQNVDEARMFELIEAAYAAADSRWVYSIYPDTEGEIILEQDLTLPYNTRLHLNMPMTVAEGCTLTLECRNVYLYHDLTVEGTLLNQCWLEILYDQGGLLTIAEGGTYTGNGQITIYEESLDDPTPAVPGLDLSQWEVRQDGDWWWYIYPIGGGGGGLTFSTMEELKALAAESYDWGYMVYAGSEDFVISEDISLPVNTFVDFGEHNVVVNQGVTASFMEMQCHDLTVHGTLNSEYQGAMGTVTVYGAVRTNRLQIGETSSITGLENIKFTNSYNPISRVYRVSSGEALVEALKKAANPQLPKETAHIQLNGGPVILTEDATLPKNCELYISNDMVIAENATLTINGMVSLGYPLTVKGTLVNNCDIYTWDGRMIIADGGKYEGRGSIRVMGGNDYNNVLQGLNLEHFQITNNYDEWRLVYVEGLPPVAAPSELEWGYTYKDGVKVALPGAVCWKSGITDTTGVEYVYFYRINEDGTETLINQYGGMRYDAKNYMDGYNSSMDLLLSDIPSGRYYFTVYSQGDYKNTRDSETVTSPIWEYTKPDTQLETAANLGWSDDAFRAEWTNPNGEDEVHIALVSWYYKDREDGYEYIFARLISQDDEFAELREYYMAMMGTGYYRYAVQLVSADITKATSSKISEQSEWYHLEKMPETPTAQLGGLLTDPNKTDEEKLEEVQNMDTEVLKDIMEENSDATDILVQLENIVSGGAAQVDVSAEIVEEVAELVVEEISIVGANLNSKVDDSLDVTLVIDKVEEVREITGNYDTSTAVQFSMTLDNVKDTKNLEVPVVVTIPVPAGIAADKVVVLHYHDDGTYDVINPEVTILGGKTYATFILTSFSDFAILEKLAALLGDVDLSEEVNVDDVLALLWYVLFPDMYPVGDVTADFDHNGSVDVDDVLTLLWYVLFPDAYPLS